MEVRRAEPVEVRRAEALEAPALAIPAPEAIDLSN
jgi:hypothetical protein